MIDDQHPVPTGFTASSTADDVLRGVDLTGRDVIVTGGHGRLGREVTRSLAELSKRLDAALPDLVYDSVRTDPLSVTPVFDRRSGVTITGYAGRCSTRLTLADFDGLSDLVVALTGLPGAEVDGPTWSLRRGSSLEHDARSMHADSNGSAGAEVKPAVRLGDRSAPFAA